jgi:hypothetical protein
MDDLSSAKRESIPGSLGWMKELIEKYGSDLESFGIAVESFLQQEAQAILQNLLLKPGDTAAELKETKILVNSIIEKLSDLSELKALRKVDLTSTIKGLSIYSGQLSGAIYGLEQIEALPAVPLKSLPSTIASLQETLRNTGSSLKQLGDETKGKLILALKNSAEDLTNDPGNTPQQISERRTLVLKVCNAMRQLGLEELAPMITGLEKYAGNLDAAAKALGLIQEKIEKVTSEKVPEKKLAAFKELCQGLIEHKAAIKANPQIGLQIFHDLSIDKQIAELIPEMESEIEARLSEIKSSKGIGKAEEEMSDYEQKVKRVTEDIHRYLEVVDSLRTYVPQDEESIASLQKTLEGKLMHGVEWTKDLRKGLWEEWYETAALETKAKISVEVSKSRAARSAKKLEEAAKGHQSAHAEINRHYQKAHDPVSGRLLGSLLDGAAWAPPSGPLTTDEMMSAVLGDPNIEMILREKLDEIADKMPDAIVKVSREENRVKEILAKQKASTEGFLKEMSEAVDLKVLMSPPISLSKDDIAREGILQKLFDRSIEEWKELATVDSTAKAGLSIGWGWVSSLGRLSNEEKVLAMRSAFQLDSESGPEKQEKFHMLAENVAVLARALDYHSSKREGYQQKTNVLVKQEMEAKESLQQRGVEMQKLKAEREMINSFARARELHEEIAPTRTALKEAQSKFDGEEDAAKQAEGELNKFKSYKYFLAEYQHLLYTLAAATGFEEI